MITDIDPITARRVIRSLRGGVSNQLSAPLITIGTRELEEKLKSHFHQLLYGDVSNMLCIVQGDWGNGKSHLRNLCQNILISLGVPYIYHSVDARGASLSHLHRCMPAWLGRLRLHNSLGLRNIFCHESLPIHSTVEWLSTQNDFFSQNLREALTGDSRGWHQALGHRFQTPDYAYHHEKALSLFCSCARLMNHLGFGGIVALLDEVENIDKQFSIIGRRKSYDLISRLAEDPHIIPVLFVTPRFFNQLERDKVIGQKNGWQCWSKPAREFLQRVEDVEILSPPAFNAEMAISLIRNIRDIFALAYGSIPGQLPIMELVEAWLRTSTRSVRLLIRLCINELDLMRQRAV